MAKITSNQNVKVAWILEPDLTNPDSPSATELNADALDLSAAIAWDGTDIPNAEDSDDNEDRALTDLGTAVTRGFANYAASLNLFADANQADTTSVYNDAKDAFKVGKTLGYLITRVAKPASDAFAAGDRVSVFKFVNGIPDIDGSGDTVKLGVDFAPQGLLYTHTIVEEAAAVVALPTTIASAPGDIDVITATLDGATITHSGAVYSSSNTAVATVSNLGIVTSVAAGSATITISHPSSNAPDTIAVTVT